MKKRTEKKEVFLKHENKSEKKEEFLKNEDKSDIQELFNDLFVGELNKKVTNVSEEVSNNTDLLVEVKKKNAEANAMIEQYIKDIGAVINCLGSVDDWGDGNLIGFLNKLGNAIQSCKKTIQANATNLGDWPEGENVYFALENIDKEIADLNTLIVSLEEKTIKNGFEKLTDKVECMNTIRISIQEICEKVDFVKKTFEENGKIEHLNDTQKTIIDKVEYCKLQTEDIHSILNRICSAEKETSVMVMDKFATLEKNVNELLVKQNILSEDIMKHLNGYINTGRKWRIGIVCGVTFSVLLNIAMMVIMLIK